MDNQVIMQAFAQSTIYVFIFGILIGSLFAIATLAIFDAIKLMRANCCSPQVKAAPTKAVPTKAVAKPAAKNAVAKKAPAKKKTAAKKKK